MPRSKCPLVETRKKLARDLLDSQTDLITLLDRHGLDAEQVRAWLNGTEDAESLRSLVTLADLQAQLMLSRYRLTAVMRLIALATDDDPKQREPARRACVDLLKAQLDETPKQRPIATPDRDTNAIDLRQLLFGDLDESASRTASTA